MTESVKVMVRCRPMNMREVERSKCFHYSIDCKNIVIVDNVTQQIGLKKLQTNNTTMKNFAYDRVFDENSTQQEVYEQSTFSLV